MHCVCIERVLYLQWGTTFTNQQVMCIVASICEDAFIVFKLRVHIFVLHVFVNVVKLWTSTTVRALVTHVVAPVADLGQD